MFERARVRVGQVLVVLLAVAALSGLGIFGYLDERGMRQSEYVTGDSTSADGVELDVTLQRVDTTSRQLAVVVLAHPRGRYGDGLVPTQDLVNEFETGDPRKDATILFAGETTPEGDVVPVNPAGSPTMYNQKSYVPFALAAVDNQGADQDVRVLRYADVLLMNAEAANETGNSPLAISSLEQVRARARAGNNAILPKVTTTDQTAMRNAIWHERRVELAMEFDRFFDVIRQGRGLAVFGVKGFKFHPTMQGFYPNDRMAYPLYEAINDGGAIALFHTGQTGVGSGMPGGMGMRLKYSNPMYMDDVAADFPDLKIILAHPSFPWQEEALSVATHKPNVYIDLSGWSPKYFPPILVRYINSILQDKMLFGSDWPVITPDRWLSDFSKLEIRDEIRPKVLKANARRILSI